MIMELKIDRTQWKKVKLGDVASEYSKRINNPSESEFNRFVGSSNINQWDFRVKSWESTDSVTSAMKLFEPNDYLLVRRSLYASDFRERAPRAHFHGICSGDILTIKENPDKVIDGFLIGVLNSPALWNYVVANASGSITRRIKWRDLANYEFLLPPKDQQAQLAELLWAMDEVMERERVVLERVKLKIKATQKMLYNISNYHRIQLKKYSTILGGYAFPSKSFSNAGTPVIKIKNIVKGEILVDDDSNYVNLEDFNHEKYILYQGDILIAMTGATLGKIGIVQKKYDGALLNQRVGKFQFKEGIDPWFMKGVLDSSYFLNELNKYIGEGAQGNISSEDISKTRVPNLNESEMIEFGEKFEVLYNLIKVLIEKNYTSKSLQKTLINQIFSTSAEAAVDK
jgi:type I restriction enzyme S subunit